MILWISSPESNDGHSLGCAPQQKSKSLIKGKEENRSEVVSPPNSVFTLQIGDNKIHQKLIPRDSVLPSKQYVFTSASYAVLLF